MSNNDFRVRHFQIQLEVNHAQQLWQVEQSTRLKFHCAFKVVFGQMEIKQEHYRIAIFLDFRKGQAPGTRSAANRLRVADHDRIRYFF